MSRRQETFRRIAERGEAPVLILGGGINGAGLLRELALQGVDCVLVDKADFAAGATSKSSRMIHGGLRYLENREFALVAESLGERNRLLDNAAHCVSPLKTTIPLTSRFGGLLRSALIFSGLKVRPGERGTVPVGFGLWFYDFITRKDRRTPVHYFTPRDEALRHMPGLRTDVIATATYWDAWITQAERLCIELIGDARAANPNCQALNYVRPRGIEDGAVVLEDALTGRTAAVRPRIVINATGAWVDIANEALGLRTSFMGGTKGSHLVVDNPALHRALDGQMVYYQHSDGRVCIVFPFLDRVIMGSTDIRTDDPDAARCEESEVQYMLETLRGVFPGLTIRRGEIVHVFCGVRPLPASGIDITANVSRGHTIHTLEGDAARPFPIYCLVGGKWTTFRALAQQAADAVLGRLGLPRLCSTERLPIGGGRDMPPQGPPRQEYIARLAREHRLAESRAADLVARYGTAAERYLAAAAGDPSAERPLETLPEYTAGEIRHIASGEQVEHLTDLICRRSLIALLGRATPPVLGELAEATGAALGWDSARRAAEVESTLAEVSLPGMM